MLMEGGTTKVWGSPIGVGPFWSLRVYFQLVYAIRLTTYYVLLGVFSMIPVVDRLAGQAQHSDPSPGTNHSWNNTPAIQLKHARDATKTGQFGPFQGQLHTQSSSPVRITTSVPVSTFHYHLDKYAHNVRPQATRAVERSVPVGLRDQGREEEDNPGTLPNPDRVSSLG